MVLLARLEVLMMAEGFGYSRAKAKHFFTFAFISCVSDIVYVETRHQSYQ